MTTTATERPHGHTRIAHLSDLHCDASDRWAEGFDAARQLLIQERPDAVLITGDCVNHPKRKYFKFLRERLTRLKDDLTEARAGSRVWVVAIPGNHDCSYFGNHI